MISTVSAGGERTRRRSRHSSANRVRLSMYSSPPAEELSLDEFETFAIDRLIVLRGIESLRMRNPDPREESEKVRAYLDHHLPWRADFDEDFEADRRKDLVSHFILRLAHCQSEDQRRWFLAQESYLFKFRLNQLSFEEMNIFTKQNGLDFDMVSQDEKQALARELQTVGVPGGNNMIGFQNLQYFRIPFVQALDLVGKRQVFLQDGMAFVPQSQLISIIVARFRTSLSRALLQAAQMFPLVSKDPRLAPLLQGVHRQYVGQDFSQQKSLAGTITPENIDLMAERSMPLCMRQLHKAVRREHKIKHAGRQQYWLYLKGAGMTMEDSTRFFHSEFSRIMSSEAFTKEHAYNIRHAYGKEGKRTNYTPYSCMKIIMGGNPGHGEYHGCPYRYMDEGNLSTLLGSMKINGPQKEAILAPVRKGHFQVACQRHFEVTHPGAAGRGVNLDGVGNHPNSWTGASMEYHKDEAGTTNGTPTKKDVKQPLPAAAAASAAPTGTAIPAGAAASMDE